MTANTKPAARDLEFDVQTMTTQLSEWAANMADEAEHDPAGEDDSYETLRTIREAMVDAMVATGVGDREEIEEHFAHEHRFSNAADHPDTVDEPAEVAVELAEENAPDDGESDAVRERRD